MSHFSSWSNTNSNQQQQQQPNAFGQPSGFGQQAQPATGMFKLYFAPKKTTLTLIFQPYLTGSLPVGFGGFSAQPPQPQHSGFGTSQPQNTFGGFGGASTFAKPTGTFGGFGATTSQPAQTGFGGFGTTTQPTGTTGFGQTAGAGPSNTGFAGFSGTTGGGWGNAGAAQPTAGFGAALTGTGQGTANPPYQAFTERDQQAAGTTLHYQAISCMAPYKNYSLEELRLQDYQANRKTASAAPAFSQQQQQQQQQQLTTGFGTTGTGFGQTTTQPPTSGFGAFSATKPTGTGLFGQTAQTTSAGFGGFGSNTTAAAGGGLFGQNTQQPATATFGQQQPAATNFGGFGQNTQNTGAGFGTFGQNNQNKPFGGGFGQTQPTTGGLGTFGQQNQTQPTTGFGQTQQPATTGFGGFGANTSNQSKPGGLFGGFGQNQPATTGFGQPAQQQPTTGGFGTGSFGGFGINNTNQQQQQPATGGLFGQPPATQQAQQQPVGGGLFSGFGLGQNQPNQQQQQGAGTTGLGGGLFGNKPSGGLFGAPFGASNTTNTNTTNPHGGLGGTAQPTLGLNTGGGLFGQNNNANNLGGGLFGKPGGLFGTSNTAAPGAGLGAFGVTANNQSTLGGTTGNNPFGAFGQSTVNNITATANNLLASTTQQPGLTAAVDQPINADLPIFKLLPPGPQSILISPPKKKTNFFQSITNNPATARHMTPLIQSQLRGFGSQPKPMFSTVLPKPGNPSLMKIPGRPFQPSLNTLSESRTKSDAEALRGSTPVRQSVKKLILDRTAGSSELSSIIQRATPGKAKLIFDGHLEAKVHDQDNEKLKGMITNPGLQRLTAPPVRLPTLQTAARPTSPIKAPSTVATDKPQEVNVANLEKGEYWTKPSIAELSKMPFPDLQNLKHFTCGRVGYGEIKFLQPVDLTTCHSIHNIAGKIITFEDRECTVYPVESEKPTRGEGLNVPAEIKLYGCWPVDKATREPIRDEKHPKFAAHLRKLKSIPETHFIVYEPGKGEWVFEVQHFSRYGLNDDDDDDEEAMDATAVAPLSVEGASPVITDDSDMEQEDDGSDDESMTTTPHEDDPSTKMTDVPHGHPFKEEPREDDVDRIPWPARIGMEPDRMKQMQTSFFSAQTLAPLRAISKRKTIGSAPPRTNSPTHLGKHPREAAVAEEHKRAPSVERASFDVPAVRAPIDPFAIINPARKFHKVGKESIVDGRENIHKDAGLALGRSFRVGWGPRGQLVHVGAIRGLMDVRPPPESLLSLKISKLPGLVNNEEDEKQHADDLLRLQVQHTTVEMGDDGIPYINTHNTLSFRTFMPPSGGDHGFESTLWKLGAALFDKLDLRVPPSMSAGALDRIENLRRKQAVGDWLRSAVSATVENAVASAPSINAQIFILLTGNQVERACYLAMEAHNFKLAALISNIGGSPEFRRDIASQLIVWRESVADAWIDDDIRKIFALMSGDVTVVQASASTDPFQKAPELRIDDGLDWKRTFGLQLWYGNYLEDTLLASTDAFEARTGTAQPQPWYLEGALKKKGSSWMARNETDALFELIKLSVDPAYGLENVLNPRAYTSSPLDYRYVWHVYVLLSRGLRVGDFSSDAASLAASAVTINYAAQLEALGMYEHAIFVLLHLDDPQSRAHAVKELLNRSADRIDRFSVGILTSLHIPDDWVALAKGSLYRSLARPYQAYEEYLKAGDQLFAHDIAVFELAPEVVVREDFDFMIKLFEPLDSRRIPVQQWEEGGKLFGQYAYAMLRIPDLITEIASQGKGVPDAEQREECEKLATVVLPRLMNTLPRLLRHSVNVRHRVALDDMHSSLVQRANALDALGIIGRRVTLDMSRVESGTRLRAVHAAAYDRFCKTIEIETSA